MNNKLFFKYLIFVIFSIHFLFSEILDHNPANIVTYNEPLNIQLFTDYSSEDINKTELYIKSDNEIAYLKVNIDKTSENYYETIVPPEFIIGDYLEYYILVEFANGKFQSLPPNDPHLNPFSIKVVKQENIEQSKDFLKADFEIIAPKQNQKLRNDDVIVSLSYFKIKDLNVEKVKVYIDDVDKTSIAAIRKNNLFMVPLGLSKGKHTIKVLLENNKGIKFRPVVWDFYIDDGEDLLSNMLFSGKFLNSYTNNELDGTIISTNISNLYLDMKSDLFDINSKFRKSSLENDLSQPHDRYSVKLHISESFDIQFGDFYPRFNDLILNGNRVRGVGIDFRSKFFQINLIKGELERSIQGDPQNGSSIIFDYSFSGTCTGAETQAGTVDDPQPTTQALCEGAAVAGTWTRTSGTCVGAETQAGTVDDPQPTTQALCEGAAVAGTWTPTYDTMDISRNNYSFEKELYGLRLGVGKKDRLNFALNIIKVEDKINSVNQSLNNTIIDIPYYMSPFDEYNSSECIDMNHDSVCNQFDFIVDYDSEGNVVPGNTTPDLIKSYPLCNEDFYYNKNEGTIYISTIEFDGETYNHIQNVWEVSVLDIGDNLQDFIYSCGFSDHINVNHLSDNWLGNKPKDNISLGTDFYFASKNNNLKIKSSFAFSLVNNNTWESIMTTADLDTLIDDYEDCYYGRTYVSVPENILWVDCEPKLAGSTITLQHIEPGINLNDIPGDLKPENLEKYYHWNTGSVPIIPFFPILQKMQGSCDYGECRGQLMTEDECESINNSFLQSLENAVSVIECQALNGECSDNESAVECDYQCIISTKDDCDDIDGDWIDNECVFLWKELEDKDECNAVGHWDDEVTLTDVLNQSEVAYNLDFSLNLKKHQLQFGIKKVGSEFNSLGNPYIQKDLIENYFIDRIRLLDNKLYLSFKFKNIKTGIVEKTNRFTTDKIDLNLNYYPGINLPSISLSVGSQYREGGSEGQDWQDLLEQCDLDNSGIIEPNEDCYSDWIVLDQDVDQDENEGIESTEFQDMPDTRSESRTDHYNLGYNQSLMFKRKQNVSYNYYHSTKHDLLYDELNQSLENYISPRSKNSSTNLNITTYYNNNFNSKIFYSNSSYNYAQKSSEYYLKQTINRFGGGFSYQNNSYIDNIGAELTYSDASGTSKYNQIGLKVFARLTLIENLNMDLSYKHLNKKLSTQEYHNNILKANLSYRF